MEKYRIVIDEAVAIDLMKIGYNLIYQIPSENIKGRRNYVFANDEDLERDIRKFDQSTYYLNDNEVN